ncbi:hypothetical protein WAI453_004935 [Rhynchosporium graminicola]
MIALLPNLRNIYDRHSKEAHHKQHNHQRTRTYSTSKSPTKAIDRSTLKLPENTGNFQAKRLTNHFKYLELFHAQTVVIKHQFPHRRTQRQDRPKSQRWQYRTAAFHDQIIRWERSTIQTYFRALYFSGEQAPYHRLQDDQVPPPGPNFLVHLVAWIVSIYYHPVIAHPLLTYYLYHELTIIS